MAFVKLIRKQDAKENSMASPFIEHVNLTVRDPERSARMMEELFGWHVRWQGPARDGGRSVHVGSDHAYLALYTSGIEDGSPEVYPKGRPLNHVGVQVDDLEETERRVISLGFDPFNHDDYEPGRRFYFFDADGIEFEIVSYG